METAANIDHTPNSQAASNSSGTPTTSPNVEKLKAFSSDDSLDVPSPISPKRRLSAKFGVSGVETKPRTESNAIAKSPIDLNDRTLDKRQDSGNGEAVQFILPDEGTPAYEALEANKTIKVNPVTKFFKSNISMKPKFKLKRKQKRFSKNFKGKVINGVHELYTLTAGMMLGIRCAIGSHSIEDTNRKVIKLSEFRFVQKLRFPKEGCSVPPNVTPPHSLAHSFKFKSYAPKVFEYIRQSFGVDVAGYMMSVCGNYNYLEFISNSKSGQFFFYSHDGKYMIKTQSKEENKFLMRILPRYYEYIRKNPHTLLVRMLGMYRVSMYHLRRKVRFVIMSSVFDTPEKIHTIYDLKGSLLGREASEKEKRTGGVLKDMDLVQEKRFLHLGPKKAEFMKQVASDAAFLAELNIMDYSLLVGIHDRMQRTESYINAKNDSISEAKMPSPLQRQSSLNSGAAGFGAHSNTPFRNILYQSIDGTRTDFMEPILEASGEGSALEASREDPPHQASTEDIGLTLVDAPTETIAPRGSAASLVSQPEPSVESPVESAGGLRTSVSDLEPVSKKDSIFAKISKIFRPTSPTQRKVTEKEETLRPALNSSADEDDDSLDSDQSSESEMSELDDEDVDEGDEVIPTRLNMADKRSGFFSTSFVTRSTDQSFPIDPVEPTPRPWTSRQDGGINSRIHVKEHGHEIYYVGIIDILQQYNLRKKTENFIKGFTHDRSLISAVDSQTYAKRFVEFLNDNID